MTRVIRFHLALVTGLLVLCALLYFVIPKEARGDVHEWEWDPASGPVAGYFVFNSAINYDLVWVIRPGTGTAVLEPRMWLIRGDTWTPVTDASVFISEGPRAAFRIWIRAYGVDGNLGPLSLPSEPRYGKAHPIPEPRRDLMLAVGLVALECLKRRRDR